MVQRHWLIDAVFAAPSGGRSIHSNSSRPQHSATRVAPCGASLSTTGRWLKSMGLGRLKNLQPKEPVQRYLWAQPGDMIHVDS